MLAKVMDARKTALREKDKVMPRVLSMVITTAREKAGAVGSADVPVTDEHVCAAIRKTVKDNNEMIVNHQARKETDKVKHFELINGKLEKLLPQMMDEDQLKSVILALGTKDIGTIMRTLKAEHTGKYNPQLASQIARAL
ncbi:GatB/YqeY domain-containing protein [Vibrio owensii]|uniref:GatB/YqeY domain-containing protein n=1 Tax=Vibrio harveyi group TaxID=717610 RepID=UPI003CC5A2EF